MTTFKSASRIAAGIVFIITTIVFFLSAERSGSLWDCGEFILGAYKLQVVHPPGAPLFLLVARIFASVADFLSDNPANIAFAVNLLSGLCTAGMATLVCLTTMLLGRETVLPDNGELSSANLWALTSAGIAAGLTSAFCSSIWFSAVEGEVYAMSTFFTALTLFSIVKWYFLPNNSKNDRWLVFACYSAGLSIGVHLLSLLTFPALALFIYFKKFKNPNLLGGLVSMALGAATIPILQKLIIVGIPQLWYIFEIPFVNSYGLPMHSGVIGVIASLVAIFAYLLHFAHKKGRPVLQLVTMGALMMVIGYSTIGMVVIRANADTPVNMNVPSDATRLLPYINREQYGERALLYGPYYGAQPVNYDRKARKGLVDFPPLDESSVIKYIDVDEKITPQFAAKDKGLFPRLADGSMGRPALYKQWGAGEGKPSLLFNISYFLRYQVNWMYWRYFMWNFVGRQNGAQGFQPWNKAHGHWESGIKPIDEARLYNMDELPETMRKHKANNHYYFLPLIFGLLGLFFHFRKSRRSFLAMAVLFLITGIGIIIYSNQPPNEPRERDYVFVGSFFTFAIWIGIGVLALFNLLKERVKLGAVPASLAAGAIVLIAPIIMAFQNFDDHSRRENKGSRDYANNFLNSVDENAIIFTYGDNDTYPLWYAQEVENIRRDVRVVNLSLISVDWYINKLRSKVNDSPPLKFTIPAEAYRGNKRNQIPFYAPNGDQIMNLRSVLQFIAGNNQVSAAGGVSFESYVPTHKFAIPTDYAALSKLGIPHDSTIRIEPAINIDLSGHGQWLTKNDLAVLDIIGSNIWERPVYFATTCQNSKLLGINDYMQYEGLALRIVPIKTTSNTAWSIYGSGRVSTDKAYDNIMNKFHWGNFDKKELHIDNSFAAAVQSHRMIFMRAGETLIKEGQTQKAVELTNKFFEVFPNYNFPYEGTVASLISILIQGGDLENAKKHLKILAQQTEDYLSFYESIDQSTINSSSDFKQDYGMRLSTVNTVISYGQACQDQVFLDEIVALVGRFRNTTVPN